MNNNNKDLLKQIEELKNENELLKNTLIQTQEHLKKYTSPSNMKKYYENHKDCIYLKQNAATELGYTYELWIYNKKGERVN